MPTSPGILKQEQSVNIDKVENDTDSDQEMIKVPQVDADSDLESGLQVVSCRFDVYAISSRLISSRRRKQHTIRRILMKSVNDLDNKLCLLVLFAVVICIPL